MKRLLLTLFLGVLAILPGLAETVTFDITSAEFKNLDVSVTKTKPLEIQLNDQITLKHEYVSGAPTNSKGAHLQLLQGTKLTLSAAEGCTITKVVYTCSNNLMTTSAFAEGSATTSGPASSSTCTWTGESPTVTYNLTAGKAARLSKVVVTYESASAPVLGDITYTLNGRPAQLNAQGALTVNVGDEIAFFAKNATSLAYGINGGAKTTVAGNEYTHTVTGACKTLEVSATDGTETKELSLKLNIPLEMAYTVNGEAETGDVLDVYYGDVVAFSCKNAEGYLVSINGEEGFSAGLDYTYTVNKNSLELTVTPVLAGEARTDSALELYFDAKEKPATVTEVITIASIDANSSSTVGTGYKDISFTMPETHISYTANIMTKAAKAYIQMRNKTNSGLITTKNPDGYVIKSVTMYVSSTTTIARKVNIYGKVDNYSSISELYSESTAGTLLGSLQFTTSGSKTITLEVNDDKYTALGFVPSDGAIYLEKIEIEWVRPAVAEPQPVVATHFNNVITEGADYDVDLRLSNYVLLYSEDADGLVITSDDNERKVANPYRYTIDPAAGEQSFMVWPYKKVDGEAVEFEDLMAMYTVSPLEESLLPHLESIPTLGKECSAVWYGAGLPDYDFTITNGDEVIMSGTAENYRITFTPAKVRTCTITFTGLADEEPTLEYTIVDKVYYSPISSVEEFDNAILNGARVVIASALTDGTPVLMGTEDVQGNGIAFSKDFTRSGNLFAVAPDNTTVAQLEPGYLGFDEDHGHYHYTLYCNPTGDDAEHSGGFLYLNTADRTCFYDETQQERHFELSFEEGRALIHLVEESASHYLCFIDGAERQQFESNKSDNPSTHEPVYVYVEVQAQAPAISFIAPEQPENGFEDAEVRVDVDCVAVPAAKITYTTEAGGTPATYDPEKGIVVKNTCTITATATNSLGSATETLEVRFRDPVEGWILYTESDGGLYDHSLLIEPKMDNFYPVATLYYSVDGAEYVEYTEDSCIVLGAESAEEETIHTLRFKTVRDYRGHEYISYFPQLTKEPETYRFAPYQRWTRVTTKAQLELDPTAEYVLLGQSASNHAMLTREELMDNDEKVTMQGMPLSEKDINDGTILATGVDAMRFSIQRFGSEYIFRTDVANAFESPESFQSEYKYLSAGVNELYLASTPESATGFTLDFDKDGNVVLVAQLPNAEESVTTTLRWSSGSRGGKFGAYTALNGKSKVYLYRCNETLPEIVRVKNLAELPATPDANETYVVTEDLTAVYSGTNVTVGDKNYTELYLKDSKNNMILVAVEEENPRNVNLQFENGHLLHEVALKHCEDAHELTTWVIDSELHHVYYTMPRVKGTAVEPTVKTAAQTAAATEGTDYVRVRYAYFNEDGTIEGLFDRNSENATAANHDRYYIGQEDSGLYHVDAMLHNGTLHVLNAEPVTEANAEDFEEADAQPTLSFSNDVWSVSLPQGVNADEVVVLYHKASGASASAPDVASAQSATIVGDRALVSTVELEESNAWYGYAHDDPAKRPEMGTQAYYEKYYNAANNGLDYDLNATFLYEGPFYSVPTFMRDEVAGKSFSVRAAVYRTITPAKAENVATALSNLMVDLSHEAYVLPDDLHNPAPAAVKRRAGEQGTTQGIRVSVSDPTDGTPTGVNEISIDNNDAAAEYYDLQGRHIQGKLVPGIYIRRAGSDIRKVTVR